MMGEQSQIEVSSRVAVEEVPDEIFKRMVVNDKKQNQFLRGKLSKGSYGVNTGKQNGSAMEQDEKSTGMRFIVVTLGVLSLAMSMMSRGAINNCITSMIDPRMLQVNNLPQENATSTSTISPAIKVITNSSEAPESALAQEGSQDNFDPILFYMTTESDMNHPPTTATYATETTTTTTEATTTEPAVVTEPATTTESPTTTQRAITTTELPTTTERATTTTQLPTTTDVTTTTTTTTTETATVEPEATTEQQVIIDPDDAPLEDKFRWTIKEQSLVKGGFYYSYFFFMILGGRLSEIYGAKYVLLLGVAGSALINLATPWMARNSLVMLIMSRTVMGGIQAGVFPAMYALINKWLTMSEASIYAPMIKMCLRLGSLFASLIPGLIPNWPNVFYLIGTLGMIWSALWLVISTSEPSTNRWVTKTELKHIMKKKRHNVQPEEEENGISMTVVVNGSADKSEPKVVKKAHTTSKKTPWLKMLTSPSVIGLIMAKITFNYCSDFMQIELPSYLKYVHNASRQRISAITTIMFAIQVSLIVFAGWLCKTIIKRRPFGVTKTTVRKMFQALCNIGGGLLLFMLTIQDCGLSYATVILQLLSVASVFAAGGETMLPYDLSEEYPATIMAIANSFANLSGVTVTAVTGFVLGDQGSSQSRWNTVLSLIAGAEILGGVLFCLLVKAEPIDFDSPKSSSSEEDVEKAPSYEHAIAQGVQSAQASEMPSAPDEEPATKATESAERL